MIFSTVILSKVTCCQRSHRLMSSASKSLDVMLGKQTRTLGKLLAETAAERKRWSKGPPTTKSMTTNLSKKRLTTLNKIFLSTVTDGLTTSTQSFALADHGLLINKVELSQCGQILNVKWSSKSLESDDIVTDILDSCLQEVRKNIVLQSVFGHSPQIRFIKDKETTLFRDVQLVMDTPQFRRDLKIYEELEATTAVLPTEEEEELSFTGVMTTNILGLKRDHILKRLAPVLKSVIRETSKDNECAREVPERLANIESRSQKNAIRAYEIKLQKTERKRFREIQNAQYGKCRFYEEEE